MLLKGHQKVYLKHDAVPIVQSHSFLECGSKLLQLSPESALQSGQYHDSLKEIVFLPDSILDSIKLPL